MKKIIFAILLGFLAACSANPSQNEKTPIQDPTISNTPQLELTRETERGSVSSKVPIIYDDDGSLDGTTALLYLLSHPAVDLKAVSISYGEAYPKVYIQHMGRMLENFGVGEIELGYGEIPSGTGSIHFPEFLREAANDFWGFPIPLADKIYPAQPAAELFVKIINQAPAPVTLFITGPCTNLAEALRLDPGIKEKIEAVYIMGGAVYAPGNIQDFYPEHENQAAEWNFVADPQAAYEVIESGLEVYLVPLDATNQVLVSERDTRQWRQGGAVGDFAADIYDGMISLFGAGEAPIWDLMTAAIMLDRQLCNFTPIHLKVITEEGAALGQSAVIPGSDANVYVCLEPDADAIRQTLIAVFSGGQ